MTDSTNLFAKELLQIEALKINIDSPFTWASGWKSPIYCDNRKVLSYPHIRDFVKTEIANIILENFEDAQAIAGVATAGIPHGVLVADILKLPFLYVRNKPKDHGLGNQIEGELQKGQKVVVIEDLISTGKSSLNAVNSLRESGANVIGMCALFSYGFNQAVEAMHSAQVPLKTISNFDALLELLQSEGQLSHSELENIRKWRENPSEWH